MSLLQIIKSMPAPETLPFSPRPHITATVRFKEPIDPVRRAHLLEEVGLNVFFFPAKYVDCDFLSDSGTTTMTMEQWAQLVLGDESYGSNEGYFELMDQVGKVFGKDFANTLTRRGESAFIFHQGRAAENALFKVLGDILRSTGEGYVIPSNGHFDTTEANIHANGISPVNLFHPDLRNPASAYAFKGDMNIDGLRGLLQDNPGKVPLVYLTVTNNTGGGQPVSMGNIRKVYAIAEEYGIPLFFDACRFAENAWFIQQYEPGFSGMCIEDIVKEMFSHVDGFTISFKKDGLVNMGGGVFLRRGGRFVQKYPKIQNALWDQQLLTEGNDTYGGMSGRDIKALVEGLKTITRQEYLDHRVHQVQRFGELIHSLGIPGVVRPIGGHAVYIDMDSFFKDTQMKQGDYPGIAFTAVLLAAYGHRACELGNFAFGSCSETGERKFPEVNYVRFAVPRLRYEDSDLAAVAHAVSAVYARKSLIPPVDVIDGERTTLRHFKAKFAPRQQ